jgi:hypothetical protein
MSNSFGAGSAAGVYRASGDLAFDYSGNLYLTSVGPSDDQLFSLNPATGQGAPIGNIGYAEVYGLVYYNSTAYGFTAAGQVLAISPITGIGSEVAAYTPGFNGTTVFAPVEVGVPVVTSPVPGITLSGSLADFSWTAASGATAYRLPVGTTPGGANIFSGTTTGTSQIVRSIPCPGTVSGTIYVQLSAEVNGSFQPSIDHTYKCKSGLGDFNGDGYQDVLWQNNSTHQVTVHYFDGAQGVTYIGWNWLSTAGEPSGWELVGAADFDGDGVPDLVWEYMPTGQVTVNYFGGPGGTKYLGWNWLNKTGNPGWTAVAPR